MRRLFLLALIQTNTLILTHTAFAQLSGPSPESAALFDSLPDSPGALQSGQTYRQTITVTAPPPCDSEIVTTHLPDAPITINPEADAAAQVRVPCTPAPSPSDRVADRPYQRFLNSREPTPLTSRQKGYLAIHDIIDPANLFTITANAGFTIGIDSHTGYGPGLKGFGRDIGYSLVQDATGEFISTYALDSLLHQDPRYHRSPKATVGRRFLHAISHTVVSQHDDGTPMLNYSTLLTYPISAELSNLYVPGVACNGPSTVKRIAIGLASDPIDNIITEFLPDFAKRVHIHAVFVQQILNNVSSGQTL